MIHLEEVFKLLKEHCFFIIKKVKVRIRVGGISIFGTQYFYKMLSAS